MGGLLVQIDKPAEGSTMPFGDSLLVAVQLQDSLGVDNAALVGLALRGDPEFGTDEEVVRYEEKTVAFEELPTDTLLRRYLYAAEDNTSETVYVIATAENTAGTVLADTMPILVGAPRIEITNLSDGDTVQSNRVMSVRLESGDPAGVTNVSLDYTGVTEGTISVPYSPAREEITLDTAITLPDQTGQLELRASARNTNDQVGRTNPLTLVVTSVAPGDSVAPSVAVDVSAEERLELRDSVHVMVTAEDNSGGSGVSEVGYTVLAMSASKSDTLVHTGSATFGTPRTGTSMRDFYFTPEFRADTQVLPDSLLFEVHAYAVDASGNCAASVSSTGESLTCGDFRTEVVAMERTGQQTRLVAVDGHTVTLSEIGHVADAVMDADTAEGRYRLYLSNFSSGRVEILNLADSTIVGQTSVGSQPWGLFIDNSGDTLIVANSGGTNLSFVPLQTGGDPTFVPQERLARRLLTPNAVLFDVERSRDEAGFVSYLVTRYDFSDRPQFIAQDSTGRYLYSTVPTEAAPDGTVRLVDEDPDPVSALDMPEARILFDKNKAVEEAEGNTAIANVDSIVVTGDGADIMACDHEPGYSGDPARTHCVGSEGATTVEEMLDSLKTLTGDSHTFWRMNERWVLEEVGMSDTTYIGASGDRGKIAFGEGAASPGRIMLWHAHSNPDSAHISNDLQIEDLVNNASERVLGVGLNRNASLGVARGEEAAYFFDENLRKQGEYATDFGGGAGAVLHPAHNETLETGESALAFVATGNNTIEIIDATHFEKRGEIAIRDDVIGSLRASHPLPGDNGGQGAACTGLDCTIAKLYGITSAGGVVIVDVKRRDISN